jgi:hypothetical protein
MRRGGHEARRRGGAETRRRGGPEAGRQGGGKTRTRGGAEVRRRGGDKTRHVSGRSCVADRGRLRTDAMRDRSNPRRRERKDCRAIFAPCEVARPASVRNPARTEAAGSSVMSVEAAIGNTRPSGSRYLTSLAAAELTIHRRSRNKSMRLGPCRPESDTSLS